MAARLAGFNVRDSQTPAATQAPAKPAPDKKPAAQQKTSGAKTSAQSAKPEATSLSQLETLLLPPGKTAAATSRPAKTSRSVLSKHEFLRLCALGESAEVEEAIMNGADPNARSNDGATALMTAVCHGRVKSAQVLLKHSADVNAKDSEDKTALIFAAEKGYVESMQILISHGANINARDLQARTALNYTRENGRIEAEKLLVSHGAAGLAQPGPAIKRKPPRKTPETEYLPAVYDEPEERPEFSSDEENKYAAMSDSNFMRLCRSGNARKIEAALKNGADANTKDNNVRTAFFLWGGRTALMWAVVFDRTEAEEILSKYGADVNARDDEGYTALLYRNPP